MSSLPWCESAEQSLLGAILLKPEILGWLEVADTCFHDPKNRALWTAMHSLHSKGVAIDAVTMEAELDRNGTLKAVGGLAYLSRVSLSCVTASNAESYAATLEEYRITREVMSTAADIQHKANGGLSGGDLLDSLVGDLSKIKRTQVNEQTAVSKTLPEMVRRMIDEVDAQAKGITGSSFVPTSITALDRKIGGVPLGTVTAIGGRPGEGKSSILLTMAESAAKLGKVSVIFTLEDVRDRWSERLISKHSKLAVDQIYSRSLDRKQLAAVTEAADGLMRLNSLHVVHAHGMAARDIVRASSALKADFVGIDYIQKVSPPEARMKLHEAIEANAKTFGDFAGKSNAAVIVLSQLSKDIEREGRRPTLSDLRYGDGLAQEAKLALLLHNPKGDGDPMAREILIAKRNQGESDLLVRVRFDGAHCRFLEAA